MNWKVLGQIILYIAVLIAIVYTLTQISFLYWILIGFICAFVIVTAYRIYRILADYDEWT
jgi:uncharacterized membrane protein